MRREYGIAMIVVLALVAFLGLIALAQKNLTSDRARRSTLALDRAEALTALRTLESEIDFALVTNDWIPDESGKSANEVVWGQNVMAFRFDGGTVSLPIGSFRIQDQTGLLPLSAEGDGLAHISRLSLELQSSDPKRRLEYQEVFRELNTRLSTRESRLNPLELSELRSQIQASALATLDSVGALVTNAPVRYFNPLTAPNLVLRARFGSDQGNLIAALRERGELSTAALIKLFPDGELDQVMLFPGPYFSVETTVQRGTVFLSNRRVVVYRPYGAEPFGIWTRAKLTHTQANR
jgi:type II secretory pathway pseudopilin PulG